MKTPKEYRDNLLNHIITKQMLVDCLYSANKRAKNYRDKERKQRAYSRCHRYVDKMCIRDRLWAIKIIDVNGILLLFLLTPEILAMFILAWFMMKEMIIEEKYK